MELIRVCQLLTTLSPGGAERCVYELATRLDRDRFEVHVAALRGGSFAERLQQAGVTVHVLGIGSKWSPASLGKLGRLRRILRDRRIDILHAHLIHGELAGRLAVRRADPCRLVATVHVVELDTRWWYFPLTRLTRRRCDRIVCVSQSVADWHQSHSGLSADAYEVIVNGIDAGAYARDPQARQKLRGQWGLGDDDVVAVFLARLEPQKGMDVLLEAAGRLKSRGCNLQIVIAGDGSQRSQVAQFCVSEAGEHCRWLGFFSDVRGLLSAADMFLMPSRTEGWPLALGEAMVAGLPAVGTNVAGVRDVLVDGLTGVMVPSEDPGKLADAMAKLAADEPLRDTLAAAGQRRIRDEFTIETNVARHARLYEELALGKGPRSGSEGP